MNSEIELRDHVFVGPLRRSVNNASKVVGSIHDDATATKLGFRGGTVAGSIHLELFPPLLLKAFGQRWFERGTISMYFLNATTDREAVRAFVKEPHPDATDAQVDIWIERDDGMRVAEGTASVGSPEEPSALLRRPLDRFDAGELRILGGLKVGDQFEECDAFLTKDAMAERMKVITEPMEWYAKPSPWGGCDRNSGRDGATALLAIDRDASRQARTGGRTVRRDRAAQYQRSGLRRTSVSRRREYRGAGSESQD